MYAVRRISDEGQRVEYLSQLFGLPRLPGAAYDVADVAADIPLPLLTPASLAEHATSEELEWYEQRFLGMQKEIFDDLAWQHEAYAMGGVGLMREIAARNPSEIFPRDLQAWEDIGSGDPDRIEDGNRELLLREQERVIQDDYDAMREHNGPVGDVITYGLGVMAENPMPRGEAYRDYDPVTLELHVETPDLQVTPSTPWGGGVTIDTPDLNIEEELPLPAGNLSNFDDRWGWIENDMLPRYQELLQDPGAAEAIVGTPVDDRAEDYRKLPLPYPGG